MENIENSINQTTLSKKNNQHQSYKNCNTYSCIYCKSQIEILSINYTTISFKCAKDKAHLIKEMRISEYIEKMIPNTYNHFSCVKCGISQTETKEQFNYCMKCNEILCVNCKKSHDNSESHKIIRTNEFNNWCFKHYSNKIISYCFTCKIHLCEECLSSTEHITHKKIFFSEIKADDEKKLVKKMIGKYKTDKKQLKEDKINQKSKLDKDFNQQITELKNNLKKAKKEIKQKAKESKSNIENNQKMESANQKNNENNSSTININEDDKKQIEIIQSKYENDTQTLESKHSKDIEDMESIFSEKDNSLADFININEIIYNTYESFNDNYFNCVNLIRLALYYCNNKTEDVRDKLKDKYESTVAKIIQKDKGIVEINKLNDEKIVNDDISFDIRINNNIKNSININEITLNLFKEKFNVTENSDDLRLSNKNLGDKILFYLSYVDLNKFNSLWLNGNKISNIKLLTFQNCSKLKKLTLCDNDISDISSLENFQCNDLEELYLNSNKINDISVLSKFNSPSLKLLNLADNKIVDISCLAIAKFKNIKTLDFTKNSISDINILQAVKLPHLRALYLSENKIEDLSVLTKINLKLRHLDLSKNNISSLDILLENEYKFEGFQLLYLSDNSIDINKYENYVKELEKNINNFKI